jgi:hypothetical protein
MEQFTFDINNPNYNLYEFELEVKKAKNENREIEFYKLNMEYILNHFIDCIDWKCYKKMYDEIIQPYLDDINIIKNVLKSDIIIDSRISQSEHQEVRISEDGTKIYKKLYNYLSRVESKNVKLFIDDLWLNSIF